MATALDVIRRALRLCKVIDRVEAPEAEDAQDAFDTLNAMLAEWHAAQIGVPDYSLASLTAQMDSDAADREAIAYQLAMRIAPEYGSALSAEAIGLAQDTFSRLRLRYFQPGRSDFSELPVRNSSYDIETDSFV